MSIDEFITTAIEPDGHGKVRVTSTLWVSSQLQRAREEAVRKMVADGKLVIIKDGPEIVGYPSPANHPSPHAKEL